MGLHTEKFPGLLLRAPPCWNKRNWNNFHDDQQTFMVIPQRSPQHRQTLLFAITEQACECACLSLILEVRNVPSSICHNSSKNCEVLDFNLSPCSERCFLSLRHLWRWNRRSVPKLRHITFKRQGITQKKEYNTCEINSSKNIYRSLEHLMTLDQLDITHDFRLSPRSIWELRSSELLRSE